VQREGVNDDTVRLIEWLAGEGAKVEANQAVAVLETSKSTVEMETPGAGYLFCLVPAGSDVPVGRPLALVARSPHRPAYETDGVRSTATTACAEQLITKKAQQLIAENQIPVDAFAGLAVVRTDDVQAVLAKRGSPPPLPNGPAGTPPDQDSPWDAALETKLYGDLKDLLDALRQRMRARFNRHVSTGNLLSDRWQLAKDYGFGEGTSVYDECLVLGNVLVGRHCWIGPHTILDGSGGTLTIGDHVDIGSGTHLYTHNTIERALTGGRAPMFKNATTIGSCCFIGPMVVIAPGAVLGDHCFVAAGTYVEGVFPSFSYLAGSPASRIGVVEIQENRARLRRFEE
jgi:acetyltransferase-like isoleucine patch superfamily enzyme